MVKELEVGTPEKKKKKFLRIKTLFRTHIWNKKKYLFHTFGGRGGSSRWYGKFQTFLYFFIEPFPKWRKEYIYLGIYVSTYIILLFNPAGILSMRAGISLGPETMEDIEPGGEEGAVQGIE